MVHLTKHIGTELHGLQLSQLTDQQKDELALLIAERSVVFLRDQSITPQQQKALGEYYGVVEVHPQVPQVPGVPGVTVMWPDLQIKEGRQASFRQPGGASGWHTDLVHEAQPAGITHLHNDTVPETGGDTLWSSGEYYATPEADFGSWPEVLNYTAIQDIPHTISFLRNFGKFSMGSAQYTARRTNILTATTPLPVPNLWNASTLLSEYTQQRDGKVCGSIER